MRSRYKITQDDGIHFVTSTIVEWIPVFTSKNYFDILIKSLEFSRSNKGMKLYAFVILDNHFHLIVSGQNLSQIIGAIKGFTSRQIIEQLKMDKKEWLLNQLAFYKKRHKTASTFQVWQEGFHPQLMFDDEVLAQKVDYIHFNPVKRGFVESPEYWRYSSARNYLKEDHSIIEIDSLLA